MKTKLIKTLSFLPVLFLASLGSSNNMSAVLAQDAIGSYNNPKIINTVQDLKNLRNDVSNGLANNIFYQLNQDLDLNNEEWTPIGTESAPFNAYFNGNGHTISNLKITSATQNNIGLFGYMVEGSIEKLTVKGSVEGYSNVGGIVGYSLAGVSNCNSYVTVKGHDCVGGIIGYSDEALINNSLMCYGFANGCHNYGAIEGENQVGGIIGYDTGDGASRCGNYGDIEGTKNIAGIIGEVVSSNETVFNSPIIDCFNVGNIQSSLSSAGICCGAPGEVISSYNAGDVTCALNPAVAICYTDNPFLNVAHCYNAGSIDEGDGEFTGCLNTAINCYSLIETTNERDDVTSVTVEELRLLSTRLQNGYENNATVKRPILSCNKEVESANIHVLEYVPEIPATCTSTGVKAYYICHCGCGQKYFDTAARYVYNSLDAIIPMLPHDLLETVNDDGSVTHHCKNCNYSVTHYAIGAEGNGTVVNPYLICNETQLYHMDRNIEAGFETYEGVYFKQIADIEINNDFTFNGIGKAGKPFKGTYDGQSFAITSKKEIKARALFVEIDSATIKNIYLPQGSSISCDTYCGSVAAIANNSTIENCFSAIKLFGNGALALGGIVGKAESCLISGCYFGGKLYKSGNYNNFEMHIGGIAGRSNECVISHSIFGGEFMKISSKQFDLITPDFENSGNKTSYLYNVNPSYNANNSSHPVDWLCVETASAFLEENAMFEFTKEIDENEESGYYIYDDSISYKDAYNSEIPLYIQLCSGANSNGTGTSIGAGNITLIIVGSIIIAGGILLIVFRKKIFKNP